MKKNNTELYIENRSLKALVAKQIKAIENLKRKINKLKGGA